MNYTEVKRTLKIQNIYCEFHNQAHIADMMPHCTKYNPHKLTCKCHVHAPDSDLPSELLIHYTIGVLHRYSGS